LEDFNDVKSTDIPLEADSDDDFKPISIKDRIRDFVKGTGLIDRIPDEVINEAVRWRLERNDAQNRGYVLDGYPKNFN
jgi:adenylate kinase family enzyme